ncbi:hypothetical protein C8Q80DRAFT_946630 [Daedaleopsis nitida]|nr:hypothetical protein C8Q80DRAFT_946630 [Daedaleopsis nitida]
MLTFKQAESDHPNEHTNGIPWKLPTVEERLKQRRDMISEEEERDARHKAAEIVKNYSDDLVARWNGEMDTLLVYAGLFSAILTAFNVQSYQLLTPPPPDPVLAALQQISSQLNSFSINPPFLNSTQQALFPALSSNPAPERAYVWLNALWFSSLILSLSAASLAIMIKQWLNEFKYSGSVSGTSLPTEMVRLRQYRLNSLTKWHVAEIVAFLPVLLQVALAVFLIGLLILLFTLNRTVANVATILVGFLTLVTSVTMLLPSFTEDCCYLSPPVVALASIIHTLRLTYLKLVRSIATALLKLSCHLPHSIPTSFSMSLLMAAGSIRHYCGKISALNLRDKELHNVKTKRDELDTDTVLMAYTMTMDCNHLHNAAAFFNDRPTGIPLRFFLSLQALITGNKYGGFYVTRDVPVELWSDVLLAVLVQSNVTPQSPDKETNTSNNRNGIYRRLTLGIPRDAARGSCLISTLSAIQSSDSDSRLMDILLRKLESMHKRQLELQDDTRMHLAALADAEIRKLWIPTDMLDERVYPFDGYLDALWMLLLSVPPIDSTHKCADTIRAAALYELDRFADVLHTPVCNKPDTNHLHLQWRNGVLHPWEKLLAGVKRVCEILYCRGDVAGLVSPKLVEAMVHYCETLDSIEGTSFISKFSLPVEQRAWIMNAKKALND